METVEWNLETVEWQSPPDARFKFRSRGFRQPIKMADVTLLQQNLLRTILKKKLINNFIYPTIYSECLLYSLNETNKIAVIVLLFFSR